MVANRPPGASRPAPEVRCLSLRGIGIAGFVAPPPSGLTKNADCPRAHAANFGLPRLERRGNRSGVAEVAEIRDAAGFNHAEGGEVFGLELDVEEGEAVGGQAFD